MADIRLGNNNTSYKVGSGDCTIYLGTTLLYSGGTPPTPPSFDGKWLATYSGGSTSSAECDSTSAITYGEISATNLVSVEIGDCVTSIGNAFAYAYSLENINIPNSVTTIGDGAFFQCYSLTSIDIPDSVTSIGYGSFSECTILTSVTIPSGVTSIGEAGFADCHSLTSFTCNATVPPTIGINAFYATNECPIYVPAESVSAYQSAWSTYSSRIQAIQ